MPAVPFTVLTVLGSLPWVLGLAVGGDLLASHWKSVSNAFTPISIVVGIAVVLMAAWWVLRRARSQGPAEVSVISEISEISEVSEVSPKD
jgi:membrane protein DedA with SNARE-associated domain